MVTRLRASRIPALLLHHRCSVGCATGVPGAVGPARRPRRELRSARPPARRLRRELRSVCRLEARSGRGPAGALHTGGALRVPGPRYLQPSRLFTADTPTNFACNSPVTISNHEF